MSAASVGAKIPLAWQSSSIISRLASHRCSTSCIYIELWVLTVLINCQYCRYKSWGHEMKKNSVLSLGSSVSKSKAPDRVHYTNRPHCNYSQQLPVLVTQSLIHVMACNYQSRQRKVRNHPLQPCIRLKYTKVPLNPESAKAAGRRIFLC